MAHYKFVTNFDNKNDNNIDENKIVSNYYQLCSFKNPKTDKYQLRKFCLNGNNEFIKIEDYYLNEKQNKRFLDSKKKHEYKIYPVYNLSMVSYPSLSDILVLKSDILSTNYNYSGFAPFK